MVEKRYKWNEGAKLEEHSHRKHKILREYVFKYLIIRCQLPQQTRFRLAIVEGFAGGGQYECGTPGSPLIFIEVLQSATIAINNHRITHGFKALEIDCLLILNDADPSAIQLLKKHVTPICEQTSRSCPQLRLHIQYLNKPFETAYPTIKQILKKDSYRNVLFNLDQCGHSLVERNTISDVMRSYISAEIFYTFSITALLAFLKKADASGLRQQLRAIGPNSHDLQKLEETMSQQSWLGVAERIVFDSFQSCAPFVSPFSINNPDGWRYWLIHFSNAYRARQAYNAVLHQNASSQAHFGRAGLNMLSYDPATEGELYLFEDIDRESAKNQLFDDIPRLVSTAGDGIVISELCQSIYKATPAHADDVNTAIIDHPDMEVLTPTGGKRRKASTISMNDVLRLKTQKSIFLMFFDSKSSNCK